MASRIVIRGVSLSLAGLESEDFVALAMAGAALAQLPAFSRSSRTALAASHSHLAVLCLRKRPASVPDTVIGALATLPALLAFIMFAAVELFGMTGFAIAAMATVERKSHAALYHLAPRKSKFALND